MSKSIQRALAVSIAAMYIQSGSDPTCADIFQWEYINPADPSQGKQQSTTLCPGGAGISALPGANLSNRNLTMAYLAGAELYPEAVCDEFGCYPGNYADLSNANLSQAYLRGANLNCAKLTGTNLSGADIRGAGFLRDSNYYPGSGISLPQLYSTASYQAHDLTGVALIWNDLTGADLTNQNLASANFTHAILPGANLTGAEIRGASFARESNFPANVITVAQLQSTASYLAHDLTGVNLRGNNLVGANLAGQNLTGASLNSVNLTGVNLSQANFTNASLRDATLSGANFTGAMVRGADFARSGISTSQLYATASYQTHDLSETNFQEINFSNANLAGQNLSDADFGLATLSGANLSQANLTGSYLRGAVLTNADFSQAILANADFYNNSLTGVNLSGANIQGSDFTYSGITTAQLYSTASYQANNLSGAQFGVVNFTGINLATQNLTNVNLWAANLTGADVRQSNLTNAFLFGTLFNNANLTEANLTNADISAASFVNASLSQANLRNAKVDCPDGCDNPNLSGANLTDAEIRGAYLGSSGITAAQLISTASFKAYSLSGTQLHGNNFGGINLAGQDLTNTSFAWSNLMGANLSGADARDANFENATLTGANTGSFIQTNGHIAGLDLTAGKSLVVRDYDGNPAASPPTGPLPIVVDQSMSMDATGTLRLVFDSDPWDSTISFAPGISVSHGGTLELTFAPEVNLATQIGRTFDLFDWTGVAPTGTFAVSSPYTWNLASLYTTGEVTLLSAPGIVPGDFNGDGSIDAGDYVFWRKTGGSPDDYITWQTNFGATVNPGSGSSSAFPPPPSRLPPAIPEPSTFILAATALGLCLARRHRRASSDDQNSVRTTRGRIRGETR